jgi:hypothetical protein
VPKYLVALLALALAATRALALEPMSIESSAAGYFGAETYCETGKWGMRHDPKHGFTEIAFSRCAHRDGRFKAVEFVDRPLKEVIWSDSKKYYRHSEGANFYHEYPLDDVFLSTFPGNRSELYPLYLSRLFNQYSPNAPDRTSTRYLQTYKANSTLSTAQYSVFERFDDENHKNSERLWVRNADRSIVRYEGLRDGALLHFAEITALEVNRPLTDAELSHHVPLFVRYSLQNNPGVFIAGLFVAAGFAGAFLWGWWFARATSLEEVVRKRGRLWRVQFRIFGGTAIALGVLALLSIIVPGKGHPPAIVFVFVLAIWFAVAFALTTFFTLMSYPMQLLVSRVARGAARHGG